MKILSWLALTLLAAAIAWHGGKGTIDKWIAGPKAPPTIEQYQQQVRNRQQELDRQLQETQKTTQAVAAVLLRDSRLALLKKDYHKAAQIAETVLKTDSNNAAAYQIRGVAAYGLGNRTEALSHLTTSIKLKADVATAYIQRAAVYMYDKNYNSAIEDLDKAIALRPDIAEAYIARGKCRQALKHWSLAETDYQSALEKMPESPRIYRQFASLYRENNNPALAAQYEAKAAAAEKQQNPKQKAGEQDD